MHSHILRRRALPIAAACAISTAALHLFVHQAFGQEAKEPRTPSAEPSPGSAAQANPPPATAAPSASVAPNVAGPAPANGTTAQSPATAQPPAESAPVSIPADGTGSPNGTKLPTVEVIQEAPKPPPSDKTAARPAKKAAPVVEVDAPLSQPKARKKPAKESAAPKSLASPPAVAVEAGAIEPPATEPGPYRPVNDGQIGDAVPGTSQGGAGLGGRFTGYTVTGGAVTTKDAVSIMQNPVSVKVIPRQVIDDQKSATVTEALVGNVASVVQSSDSFYEGFTIRGFDNSNIFRNNLRTISNSHQESANIQSIEVLKGPAAMFFGRLEPGGAVNYVLKRPLETPYTSVEQQIDSYGMSRTLLDTTGALTPGKSVLYRLNLDYSDGDTFRDFVWQRDFFIAPTIAFHPTKDFRLNIDGEFGRHTYVADADTAIPAIGNRPADIPITHYLQNPEITAGKPSVQERWLTGYDWTYDLAPGWSLTNRLSYEHIYSDQRITNIVAFDETTGIADRGLADQAFVRTILSTNLDLTGKLATGPLTHSVLAGVDFLRGTDEGHGFTNYGADPQAGPINIFAPDYSFTGYTKPALNDFGTFPETWTGLYGQDMISVLDDRVHLLFGGRYDWANVAYGFGDTSPEQAAGPYDPATGWGLQSTKDQAFSPRAGIVVQPQNWLSLYGSYSRSFGTTNGIPYPGNPPFPPEEGKQWEGGAKAEFLDKRLTATAAYFDITKSNIVQFISGTPYARPVGLVESRGFEFEIAGRIDEQWSVLGNYSYDDARILEDEDGNTGHRLKNVPRHAGSIWVKYDADGQLKGLSLGAGVTAMGDRFGDNENDFVLPAFARVDAMAQYRFPDKIWGWGKNTTLQFNVKNVFDEVYYTNSYDRFSIRPGAPRTFLLSLRSEF